MANVYCAIYGDSDYWDGTIEWGYDATSDKHNPTAHVDQAARDAQYIASFTSVVAWEAMRDGQAQATDDEYGIIQTLWDTDDGGFYISGWPTTTGSVTVRAIGDARQQTGIWEDGADSPYRSVALATSYVIRAVEPNTTIDGIQIHNTIVDDTDNMCLEFTKVGVRVSNCILNVANGGGRGIDVYNVAVTIKIWNNIIYCPHVISGLSKGIYIELANTAEIYNNTVYNFAKGIDKDSGTMIVKNNAVFSNTDDFDIIGGTVDYNASDDGDGNNPQAPSGGDWANEMSNYDIYDFTLDGAGNLHDNAVTDPGGGLFSKDIKGTTRTVPWSIGAFEYDVVGGEAKYATIFDGIGVTDAIDTPLIKVVALSESAGVTDVILKIVGNIRSKADSVSIGDTISKVGTFIKSIADTIGIADVVTKIGTFKKSLSDGIGVTDTLTTMVFRLVALADTVEITDIISKIGTFIKSISDSVGITDLISKVKGAFRSESDGVGITDVINAKVFKLVFLTATVGITDAISKVGTFVRSKVESIGITDSISKMGTFIKSLTDTVEITDTLNALKRKFVGLVDNVGISDLITAIATGIQRIWDSFGRSKIVSAKEDMTGKIAKTTMLEVPKISEIKRPKKPKI